MKKGTVCPTACPGKARKNISLFFCFLLCFFSVSCASTKVMVSDPLVTDSSMELGTKLTRLGFDEVVLKDIEVFNDGSEWAERLAEKIGGAQEYVVITSFLAAETDENEFIYDAIVQRALAGVPVYILVDSAAEMDMTESRFHMRSISFLRQYGVHVFEYNPFSLNRLANAFNMFFREHRKFCVVDGRWVSIGGMNISWISTTSWKESGQRDGMYCFDSPYTARLLTESFVEFWNTYSWEEIPEETAGAWLDSSCKGRIPVTPELETEGQEDNGEDEGALHGWLANQYSGNTVMPVLYGSMFASARHEILILPFLPITNADMRTLISNAVQRGVRVEIVLPNDPRNTLYKAAHYVTKDLIEAGAVILAELPLEETKNLLHEKLVVIDSRYVLIGSVNFNYRSMVLANEVGILIDSPEFASAIKEHYLSIKSNTYEITEEEAARWRNFSGFINYLIEFLFG